MRSAQIAALLDEMLNEQLSDDEAGDIAEAYFLKRAQLKGTIASPDNPLTAIEQIALMENRLKRIEQHLGLSN